MDHSERIDDGDNSFEEFIEFDTFPTFQQVKIPCGIVEKSER